MIEYRRLGKTELKVSIIAIGGCAPGIAKSERDAIEAFKEALKIGLNIVDIAPTYGKAEDRLGEIIKNIEKNL